MTEYRLGALEATVEDNPSGPLCIRLRGESEASDAAVQLRGLFDAHFGVASIRGLELDFRGLDYMNSSTFPPVVELIRKLHEVGAKITVLFSEQKGWQRTPFTAISAIASVYDNLTVRAC